MRKSYGAKEDRYRYPGPKPGVFRSIMRELHLERLGSEEKFVPDAYKLGDGASRLAVLQGLMGSDGRATPSKSAVEFASTSEQLTDDRTQLAEALECTCAKRKVAGKRELSWVLGAADRSQM